MEKKQGIGFFEKYLTIWVALCIIVGIAVGQWLPAIPQTLSRFEYANVSIPVAILIWLMIYPMMLKVDFQSVKHVSKRPKGILPYPPTSATINKHNTPYHATALRKSIAWVLQFFRSKNRAGSQTEQTARSLACPAA